MAEKLFLFNQIGEKCSKSGLTFAYHNHAHEFKLDQGQYPLEVLFENTNQNKEIYLGIDDAISLTRIIEAGYKAHESGQKVVI